MELVRSHLSTASRSNDFSSPTVISDFDEDIWNFDIVGAESLEVSYAFNDLINSIRHIK